MTAFADDLKTRMAPVMTADFADYIDGVGEMFSEVESYVRDDDVNPGWSKPFDLTRADTSGLGYLAQFAGVRIPTGTSDTTARQMITNQQSLRRGTRQSFLDAAQLYLTGTKFVDILERNGGAYLLTIITRTSETPDPPTVLKALMAVKPAGIVLTYTVAAGFTWDEATGTWNADTITWDSTTTTHP